MLKRFRNFKIDMDCKKYGLTNYTINDDKSIDIKNNLNWSYSGLKNFPLKINKISGDFFCNNNSLISLVGGPEIVIGNFYCANNNITTLKGCPKSIGGYFDCQNNNLISFEGFPEFYDGMVRMEDNPVFEIIDLFPFKRHASAINLINEFDVIRNGKHVVLDRLEEVFAQMNLDIPLKIRFKNYKIT